MSTIIKEFIYTGGVNIADVPHGTTTLTLHLWGGAGGGIGSARQCLVYRLFDWLSVPGAECRESAGDRFSRLAFPGKKIGFFAAYQSLGETLVRSEKAENYSAQRVSRL